MASNGAPAEDFDKLPIKRVVKRPVPRQVVDFDSLEGQIEKKPRQVVDFDSLESRTAPEQKPRQMSRRTFLKLGGLVAGGAVAAALGIEFVINPDLFGPRYLTFKEYVEHLYSGIGCARIKGYDIGDTLYIKDKVLRIDKQERNNRALSIICESYPADHVPYGNAYIVIFENKGASVFQNALRLRKGDEFIFTTPIIATSKEDDDCPSEPIADMYNDSGKNTIRKVT